MKTIAQRRAYDAQAKARAARKLKIDGAPLTPKNIGRHASMHNTCPCWMCTMHDPEPQRKLLRDLLKLNEE